jgi:branched-chain amino acid:cation transporter, LIVCS family
MKRFSLLEIISTGFAIFSMFFGAGNLILPLMVGLNAGNEVIWGAFGFLITGVLLPLLTLVTIILFNGNYQEFFGRLGAIPGSLFIFFCMLIIGPLYVIPRLVTFSHTMAAPFLWNLSLPTFAVLFLGLTFLGCYKKSKILDLLGHIVSPLLIISLGIIIIKGLVGLGQAVLPKFSTTELFWDSLKIGYATLDVIGAIFFSSIVISILRQNAQKKNIDSSNLRLARTGFQAGLIGLSLLAVVYIGMCYLGAYYGNGLENLNAAEIFSTISFRILGCGGAIIIAIAVLACYSTIVPLSTVVSEYFAKLSNNRVTYIQALVLSLVVAGIISTFGLSKLMDWYKPVINAVYPALVVLSLSNLAYKTIGFRWVKTPVLITLVVSSLFVLNEYLHFIKI